MCMSVHHNNYIALGPIHLLHDMNYIQFGVLEIVSLPGVPFACFQVISLS